MKRNFTFTENDILLLAYNELEADMADALREELKTNHELMRYYQATMYAKAELDKALIEPSPATISSLLQYLHSEEAH